MFQICLSPGGTSGQRLVLHYTYANTVNSIIHFTEPEEQGQHLTDNQQTASCSPLTVSSQLAIEENKGKIPTI